MSCTSLATIVPVYDMVSNQEIHAMKSLCKIKEHRIFIIGIEYFYKKQIALFEEALPEQSIEFVKFNEAYFKTTQAYSLLLTSSSFYSRFIGFEYVLIFQLDAFIIHDKITDFIDQKYSYVGAPWLEPIYGRSDLKVGNGGLSLRRVPDFIHFLSNKKIVPASFWKVYIYCSAGFQRVCRHLFFIYLNSVRLFTSNDLQLEVDRLRGINEDVIFAKHMGPDTNYNWPSFKEALNFSFETKPSECYILNNNDLPMGCHAYNRYNPDFWKEQVPTIFVEDI